MIPLPTAWPGPEAQRRLAVASSVLLAVVLAWLAARIFWVLVAPGELLPVTAQARPLPVAEPPLAIDLGRYHLFGEFASHPTVAAYHDAPETSLNLELRGIVSSADPASGFAIIVAGGRQAAYDVGEEVPGGAEVRGIYPDRVVLLHNGRHETLRLPVEYRGAGVEPGAALAETAGEAGAAPAGPPVSLVGWADKLSVNFDAADPYSLIPVRDGGYRLFLSRDAGQMARLGLRNGDVIRSANGIPLDSHAAVERVIAEVLAGETLTLHLERDGADMTLTPDLEQILSGVR